MESKKVDGICSDWYIDDGDEQIYEKSTVKYECMRSEVRIPYRFMRRVLCCLGVLCYALRLADSAWVMVPSLLGGPCQFVPRHA